MVRDVGRDAFSPLIHTAEMTAVNRALLTLDAHWKAEIIAPLLDLMSVPRSEYTAGKTIELLADKTGQEFGRHLNDWYFRLWTQPENGLSLPGLEPPRLDLPIAEPSGSAGMPYFPKLASFIDGLSEKELMKHGDTPFLSAEIFSGVEKEMTQCWSVTSVKVSLKW